MDILFWSLFTGLGLGVVLGLLGGGGALLAIPILLYGFHFAFRVAVASSLLIVLIGTLPAIILYARQGEVDWKRAGLLGASGSLGSLLGSQVSAWVPVNGLMWLLIGLMLLSAWAMLNPKTPQPQIKAPQGVIWKLLASGLGIGLLTGLLGVGGGFLLVPALVLIGQLPARKAVASSLVVIAINALFGVVGYTPLLSHHAMALLPFALAVPVGSIIGAQWAYRLSQSKLKKAFGILLVLLALLLIVRPIG